MMWRSGGGICPFCGGTGGWNAGGMLMMFFGLLVFIGIVLLIIWAIRQATDHGRTGEHVQPTVRYLGQYPTTPSDDAAIAAARHRYAVGEITKEQLDEILATLRER